MSIETPLTIPRYLRETLSRDRAFAIIAIVTLLASIDARLAEAPSGGGEEAEEGPPPDGLCRGRPDG